MAAVQAMLRTGEEVVDVRPRSWWMRHRTFLAGVSLGTVAFVVLVGVAVSGTTSRFIYYTLVSGVFPVLLVLGVVQGVRARNKPTWVAVTNQRVIQWDEDADKVLSVQLAKVLAVETRTNYLMAMKELELKVEPEGTFNSTTVSRQAPWRVEYIDGLLDEDRVLMERLIKDAIPVRVEQQRQEADFL